MLRRFASLLFATWFAFLVAEPVAVHACAMHASGGHAAHGAVGETPVADATADEHAHHHEDHQAPTPSEDSQDEGDCQCLLTCAAGVAPTLAGAPVVPAATVATTIVRSTVVATEAAPRAPAARLLPWANAPPRAAA